MNRWFPDKIIAAFVFLCLISCGAKKRNDLPYDPVRIIAKEYGYKMPDTIDAGYNLVRLVNTGALWHEACIFRFRNDSFSIGNYLDTVKSGIDFPDFSEDVGGPGMTVPNDSNDVIINLHTGKYGIICTIDNHLMVGMSREFFVREKQTAYKTPPDENATLTLSDTGFNLSTPLFSGDNLIRVINRGKQNHEVDFIKLSEGKTKDDYIIWVHNRSAPPSGVPVGGTLDIIPGAEVWLPLHLSKGSYYLSCMVPDSRTGKMHLDMGINGDLVVH